MTIRTPPTFVTVLLKHCQRAESPLLGDLAEEFRNGRSRWWYWNQAVAGIVVSVYRDVRNHWVLTLCGLYIGVFCYQVVLVPVLTIRVAANGLFSPLFPGWPLETRELWDVPILFGAYVVIGWLTARLNREHRIPSLFMLIGYKGCIEFPWFALFAVRGLPRTMLARYFAIEIMMLLVFMVGTLIGGTRLTTVRRL